MVEKGSLNRQMPLVNFISPLPSGVHLSVLGEVDFPKNILPIYEIVFPTPPHHEMVSTKINDLRVKRGKIAIP